MVNAERLNSSAKMANKLKKGNQKVSGEKTGLGMILFQKVNVNQEVLHIF